jgi:hypothetical protein
VTERRSEGTIGTLRAIGAASAHSGPREGAGKGDSTRSRPYPLCKEAPYRDIAEILPIPEGIVIVANLQGPESSARSCPQQLRSRVIGAVVTAWRQQRSPGGTNCAETAIVGERQLRDLTLVVLTRGLNTDERHKEVAAGFAALSRKGKLVIVEHSEHKIDLYWPYLMTQSRKEVMGEARKKSDKLT